MKDFFEISENTLYINYDPINDLDRFANICMDLITNNENKEICVTIIDSVNSIHSNYIGVLMSCVFLCKQLNKRFYIKCNDNVSKLLKMLGGYKLEPYIEII